MITPRFKVITSNAVERFEERLNAFVESLDRDDMVVDIEFATCSTGGDGVEYTALIQYQKTESWT